MEPFLPDEKSSSVDDDISNLALSHVHQVATFANFFEQQQPLSSLFSTSALSDVELSMIKAMTTLNQRTIVALSHIIASFEVKMANEVKDLSKRVLEVKEKQMELRTLHQSMLRQFTEMCGENHGETQPGRRNGPKRPKTNPNKF